MFVHKIETFIYNCSEKRNMLSGIKKKVVKEYTDTVSTLSEITVKNIIKRQLGKKAKSNANQIHEDFEYFYNGYINCIKTLKNDYNLKKIKYPDGVTKIQEEITDMKSVYKTLSKKRILARGRLKNSILNLQNLIEKWRVVNLYYIYYPIALDKLVEVSGKKKHDGLDVEFEKEYIKGSKKVLEEDFTMVLKQIKEDKRGS